MYSNVSAHAARRLGGQDNFLVSSSTTGLSTVAAPSDFSSFFGAGSVAAYASTRSLTLPTVRYCTASTAETEFCSRVSTLSRTLSITDQNC